ncbi:hypothetical protein VZQ01_28200 [Myxococcus faecalis]|jgi:hypothetical protein|uniref:hypothetical protein n=1 Tax=Myxococcus TaxID=32 RepID=UPI001CC134A6|nr:MULTISPECIES: hypothetical protein [unclassified Myxococcus]MBZ4394316.1 hypothetical protein [Myxococcus sp. AS-1-15]MBZ4410410.1 hypothetical protein [Myxococcus sp. XM-1-1-1]BDT37145.1 hypothetical protein MFMH1_68140 [Myxococcus sp. MH1]
MSQTSFAVFTCDILPTADASVRSAIQGVVRAELSKPHRRVRQPLGNQWLVRFDDGGFNAFVLVLSTLRARYPESFRYLVVGWNDMGSVALYPLGGATPTTLSLVTAMAAVASGADELAAPLLLASGPLTADDFPLQWADEAGEAQSLLGASARARRVATPGPRRSVTRRARAAAPVISAAPVQAEVVVSAVEVAPAPVVSEAPATEATEATSGGRKGARRKGARKAGTARAKKAAGGKARGKQAAKVARTERTEEAAKRRRPTATSKRTGGKRRGTAVSAKRSTSGKPKAAKAKTKTARAATKRKGKKGAR